MRVREGGPLAAGALSSSVTFRNNQSVERAVTTSHQGGMTADRSEVLGPCPVAGDKRGV